MLALKEKVKRLVRPAAEEPAPTIVETPPPPIDDYKKQRLQWVLEHFRCPECGHEGPFQIESDTLTCGACSISYDTKEDVIQAIKDYAALGITAKGDIASQAYDHISRKIIEDAAASGGMVLDVGCGFKEQFYENVIYAEIFDYPSTDIICANQKLPFKSASFDALISLNVLEHVSNPFESVDEILRVLKPGGKIYCVYPFLQPEHGYPHHFFNATRSGALHLFGDRVDVEVHEVPLSGLPIWSLHWFLGSYAAGLEGKAQEEFMNLKISDILGKHPLEWLESDVVKTLEEERNWELACTTSLLMNKK